MVTASGSVAPESAPGCGPSGTANRILKEGIGLASLIARLLQAARRQRGQGMVEYALILVLVSIVVIIILTTLGGTIQNVFSDIVAGL